MKRLTALILLCVFSLTVQASLVDWKVGDPGTTYQQWLFNTGSNPALPQTDQNPYGDAVASVGNALNPQAFSWSNGAWSGTAFSVTADIPNNPVANPYKEILVEMVYQGQIVLSWAMDSDWKDFENLFSVDTNLGNGWMKRTDLWRIEPNPNSERLCYGFNSAVTGALAAIDSLTVSTICASGTVIIPEPMTLILLGLGIVASRKVR